MPSPRPRSTFSENKRAAILRAASEVFLRHGFTASSMDTVAEVANVSKRTVYNHFPSKDALFDTLIDEKWQSIGPVASSMPPRDLPVETRLKVLARDRLRILLSQEVVGLFRIVFAESVVTPTLMRAYLGYTQRSDFLGLGTVLSEETKRGRLAIEQQQMAATQFWGLVLGGTFWPLVIGVRAPPDETELEMIIEDSVRTFLARYKKRSRT